MIIRENIPGTDWYRTYSDIGRNLLQNETGIVYGDGVIDHVSNTFTYTEVEEGLKEEITDEEAYRIITGEDFEDARKEDEDLTCKDALDIILNREVTEDDETSGNGIQESN